MQPYTDILTPTVDAADLTNVLIASEALMNRGALTNEQFHFVVAKPLVTVRDRKTGFLVAYSETHADFTQSVDEFLLDYWVRAEEN
jgi:hypothetical protein